MQRRTNEPLDESERGEWKSWLKTQHSKNKIVASGPIISWKIDGETVETVTDFIFSSVQFSSVTQSCLTLCDPMNRSTPGIAVHHQLLEFTQTHIHWVSDAIQPSLSSPSPAPNPSQHESQKMNTYESVLMKWMNLEPVIRVKKVRKGKINIVS